MGKKLKKYRQFDQSKTVTVSPPLMPIAIKHLFLIYAVIPISLIIVLIDSLLLNHNLLRSTFSNNPEQWFLWTAIFGTPHIVASLITLADREYIKFYNTKLLIPLVIISAGLYFIPVYLGTTEALFIYAVYTMYHVLAQQFGISIMLLKRKPDILFTYWKWLSVLVATALYYLAYDRYNISRQSLLGFPLHEIINVVAAAVVAIASIIAYQIYRTSNVSFKELPALYLGSNVAMIIAAYLCAINEYTFFLIAIPRVIHDVTAYIIYSTHDQNRNVQQPKNIIYKALAFTGIPPLILCPVLSIAIAYAIMNINSNIAFISFYLLALLHYHFESFLWKKDGLHRNSIKFVY